MAGMDRWRGRVAMVTGASAGIGRAVARRLAREGMAVAACARREDRLEELAQSIRTAGGEALVAAVDLLPGLETMDAKIERYAQPLRSTGLEVEVALRPGQPSTQIIAHVEEVGADLLIIGSHSKRGPLDIGLGSTASALLKQLDVTVLTVRPTHAEQERAKELAIPKYPFLFPYS